MDYNVAALLVEVRESLAYTDLCESPRKATDGKATGRATNSPTDPGSRAGSRRGSWSGVGRGSPIHPGGEREDAAFTANRNFARLLGSKFGKGKKASRDEKIWKGLPVDEWKTLGIVSNMATFYGEYTILERAMSSLR
ncbi:hypothetical protein TeGR_g12227 [Tetraparma gracilis]|jgi:hypothetical protein|uniref:Uncharacterized protein n=1 Tax=Tetraparma gracilis TaxID=2962635 RepID=A0ABQ6MXH8_9STRA|nr:hypothetical protein TeGR_g12227 [Tetraparma gracilis]